MIKPSQIVLRVPPLTGTMKKTEREVAAALIVRACQVNGDEWKPVDPLELGLVITADINAGTEPLASLNRNPFCRPNFDLLADGTYARWTGEPRKSAIEFTPAGIEAMKRWATP